MQIEELYLQVHGTIETLGNKVYGIRACVKRRVNVILFQIFQ